MRAGRAVRMSEKRRPSCTPAHNVVVVVVVAQSNPFPPISFIFPLLSRCVPFFRYFFFHVASRIFFFLFRLHDQGRPSESRPLCGRHRLSGNAKYGCQMSALTWNDYPASSAAPLILILGTLVSCIDNSCGKNWERYLALFHANTDTQQSRHTYRLDVFSIVPMLCLVLAFQIVQKWTWNWSQNIRMDLSTEPTSMIHYNDTSLKRVYCGSVRNQWGELAEPIEEPDGKWLTGELSSLVRVSGAVFVEAIAPLV